MENDLTKYFIRQGVIFGLIQVILYYLIYFMHPESLASFSIGFLFILFIGVYSIIITVRYKRKHENYISLKEAFQVCFFSTILRGLIAMIFVVILFNVVDQNLASYIKDKVIQNTTAMMEKFGAPEDKMNESLDKMKDMDAQFTVMGQIKGYLYSIIIAGIYSLIIAAIVKKNKPPFDAQTEVANPS